MDAPGRPRRLALVASKGTLDMAYPPLTLATTAASMGWEAGIFFTFYGLDIVHKARQRHLAVSPVGNPAMPPPLAGVPLKVPTLVGALPGMTAVATTMMKGWMDRAHMAPVLEMLEIGRELGVRYFACNTTLGVMGIDPGDLIDGVERVGAPAFLDYAAEADVQLFI
ncbi:MAG TPA: DsrE/DsrF/DrsH-like family protein [Chloroflexota bacterium]|jgi:peroxiredoxin family protein